MSTNMQDNTSALLQLDEQLRSLNSYTSPRMPIIELTSVADDGAKIPSEEHPHQFNFRVVGGGSLRENDEIQLCYRTLTTKNTTVEAEDGTEIQHRRRKYKYRCFCSQVITNPRGALTGGLYIKVRPVWTIGENGLKRIKDKKTHYALMHNQRESAGSSHPSLGYIYLRIKRAFGEGNSANTIYSNIIPIGKTTTGEGEIHYYI